MFENELCEAEQILIANEAIAYPDVHKIILNCEIGIKQMQALLEIRKLLENNDSKQMMGEKEVLNILDEILNSFCTEKNRVRWDLMRLKYVSTRLKNGQSFNCLTICRKAT